MGKENEVTILIKRRHISTWLSKTMIPVDHLTELLFFSFSSIFFFFFFYLNKSSFCGSHLVASSVDQIHSSYIEMIRVIKPLFCFARMCA